VHNTAQYIHCLAQGKVGSGFDVSSATYGSQLYQRFSPDLLTPLMGDKIPDRLLPYLEGRNSAWNQVIKPFKLPPYTRLLLADVNAGSSTIAAVGQVLAWKKGMKEQDPKKREAAAKKALELWAALGALNDKFTAALLGLNALYKKNPGAYQAAVTTKLIGQPHAKWADDTNDAVVREFNAVRRYSQDIREKMREMGRESNVEIEPPSQTELINKCIDVTGAIAGGVPGAGGFDAIWVLVLDPPNAPSPNPMSLVGDVWKGFRGTHVSPLLSSESSERGVRTEGPEVLEHLKKVKYI